MRIVPPLRGVCASAEPANSSANVKASAACFIIRPPNGPTTVRLDFQTRFAGLRARPPAAAFNHRVVPTSKRLALPEHDGRVRLGVEHHGPYCGAGFGLASLR